MSELRRIKVSSPFVQKLPTADVVLDDILAIIATDSRKMRIRVEQSTKTTELELVDAKKLEMYGKIALTIKQQQAQFTDQFQKLPAEEQQRLAQEALATLQKHGVVAAFSEPEVES